MICNRRGSPGSANLRASRFADGYTTGVRCPPSFARPRNLFMLRVMANSPMRLCDRVSRREILRSWSGALGCSLPELLHQQSATASSVDARFAAAQVVHRDLSVWRPAEHSTWDPKPNAPAEVRGEFGPIATRVPGCRSASYCRTRQPWPNICACCGRCAPVTTPIRRAAITCSPACRISR